jgi:hypothetical protein
VDNEVTNPTPKASHPKIFFRTDQDDVVSIYRCVLFSKTETPTDAVDKVRQLAALISDATWAVVLTGGGHFASAIFRWLP